MGLLPLLFAVVETLCDTAREKREHRLAVEEQRRYEDIDFNNVDHITLDDVEQAYRIETEEEFDPVMSNFLTEQDGWPHYETKTVEYEVEDGANYCFTIHYKNGTKIYRKFHESAPITQRIVDFCNKTDDTENEIPYVIKGDTLIIDGVGNTYPITFEDEE